jgi:hypothetical protein
MNRFNKQLGHRQGGQIKVDIAFCLDATGSTGNIIAAMIMGLLGFLDILVDAGLDALVGLVVFRDETYGEKTLVYDLTDDYETIRDVLKGTVAKGGGDDPESALTAIRRALELDGFREGAQTFILMITDTSCHDPENGYSSQDALAQLLENNVVFFACSPPIEPYKTFVNATRGILFPIEVGVKSHAFQDVLLSVARATVKTMRAIDSEVVPSAALDELRKTLRGS